ncbi:helix-turn-helix domain-containing protein [Staphylococcus hominis]|uniref:helix-turn-helix domain-containing protein n=1 Tax=Staphylococcus hominis TaxID=1290 RepID=UPI00066B0759|nr:helix-turn-helix transcriptional regulator [Staphylococcus hominis]
MKVSINKKELQKAMFLKGYTLTELSNKTDVGISYLSQVLHNKKKASPKLAKNIANALDVEIKDLFYFEEQEA